MPPHRCQWKVRVSLLVLTAALVPAAAGVGWSQTPRGERLQPASAEERRDILRSIHTRIDQHVHQPNEVHDPVDDQGKSQLVALRGTFPEIPVGRGDQVRFVRMLLNGDGLKVDAVRFRTPATGERFTLLSEFVCPGTAESRNVRTWGLIGIGAEAPDLHGAGWSRRDDYPLPNAGLPSTCLCVTQEPGGTLEPGAEYLFWFDFKTSDPTPLFIKVRLTPVEPNASPRTQAVQKPLGNHGIARAAANRKFDSERKALLQTYVTQLEKAHRDPGLTDDTEKQRIAAELAEIRRGVAASAGHRGLQILRADFGVDERWVDVTRQVRDLTRGDVLRFRHGLGQFGPDPAERVLKSLIIIYTLDGNLGTSITREGQDVELPPVPALTGRIPVMQ